MDVGEIIFEKALSFFKRRRLRKREATEADTAVHLTQLKDRLTIVARALAGEPLELEPAEEEGGYSGQRLYLPVKCVRYGTSEANAKLYLFRTAYMVAQRSLGLNWPTPGKDRETSRAEAGRTAPLVLERLQQLCPRAGDLLDELFKAEDLLLDPHGSEVSGRQHLYWLWGKWMPPADAGPNSNPKNQSSPEHEVTAPPEITTEVAAKPQEHVDVLEVDRDKIKDYTLSHNFEKVDTAEEFLGTWRDLDGTDELSAQKDALDEVRMNQVVRVDDPVHSIYQIDLRFANSGLELAEADTSGFFVSYDEWDLRKKAYRKDHCKVFPKTARLLKPGYANSVLRQHRSTLMRLRRKLNASLNEMAMVRRQPYGEHPDLDAVVENLCNLKAQGAPSENLYLSQRTKRRELSVLILIDMSLSTDGYAGGLRIFDVEREAVMLFGELLEEFGDRVQIDGFSSRTRHHCDYLTLKGFDEPWQTTRDRLGAIEPEGYTRIGPAIRHATSLIEKETSRTRWILFLSDGKPSDYDRYEGRYGMADVRQAIKEAHAQQIQTFALAVEAKARNYLPAMLGHGGYRILPAPSYLPDALANFYQRLLH